MVGGTFESGPRPDGGFHIKSVLPSYVPTTVTWIRSDNGTQSASAGSAFNE
ncbi:hypothetical protein GCM10010349_79700 [Streptomyces flavofungini]|nr:hypothetical protein GCM10010349_79700 [Streptomyces flavofungini]